jgi:enoyl-CoA hydratase
MASPTPNGIVCYATSTLTLIRCLTNLSILILTITADATLNAQDLTLLQSIHYVLHVVVPSLSFSPSPGRPSPRVLILTAEGSRRFIGAVIPELLLNADRAAGVEASRIGQENANALERGLGNNIVTIAAVNGTVIGGGLDMMLACDFAVADTRARFRQAEVLGGVIPAFGGSWRLTRAIGKGRARVPFTSAPLTNK